MNKEEIRNKKEEVGSVKKRRIDIHIRVSKFVIRIFNISKQIKYSRENNVIIRQLLRSSASIGANIYEARVSRTKKEFISCLHISLKESNETNYWLYLLLNLLSDNKELTHILDESQQINKILGQMIINAKKRVK